MQEPAETGATPGAIETRRLVLRPMRAGDAAAVAAPAGSAIDAARSELADARAWMARARLLAGAKVLAIQTRDGRLIGSAGTAPMSDQATRREMSLWIGEDHAGRGFGTEAAHALIDAEFVDGAADVLWAACRFTNAAARRLLEKCGFQFRERGMARSVTLRGAVPIERFALERRTWASLKDWGGLVQAGADARAPAS